MKHVDRMKKIITKLFVAAKVNCVHMRTLGQANLKAVPRTLRPLEAAGTRIDLVPLTGVVTLEQYTLRSTHSGMKMDWDRFCKSALAVIY
jgi:hypothetical protein